jgi:hypothetical protein
LLRVECRAGIEDVILGRAVLCVVTGDATDSDTRCYWVKADVAHTGHIVSWQLQKFVTGERYNLAADCCTMARDFARQYAGYVRMKRNPFATATSPWRSTT